MQIPSRPPKSFLPDYVMFALRAAATRQSFNLINFAVSFPNRVRNGSRLLQRRRRLPSPAVKRFGINFESYTMLHVSTRNASAMCDGICMFIGVVCRARRTTDAAAPT